MTTVNDESVSEEGFVIAAALADVMAAGMKRVEIGGYSILLCRNDDQIFAVENLCSHAEQPLECGRIKYGWISCPSHGSRFDLETGEALSAPATEPIKTFALRTRDDMIEIKL